MQPLCSECKFESYSLIGLSDSMVGTNTYCHSLENGPEVIVVSKTVNTRCICM